MGRDGNTGDSEEGSLAIDTNRLVRFDNNYRARNQSLTRT